VPDGLKAFFSSLNAPIVPQKNPARSRRRQSRPKFDEIATKMRSMDEVELRDATEKSLAHKFGASRDTVRRARKEVLGA
jgi:hypothetical protein